MNFPTEWSEILKRIDDLNPIKYAKDRNYIDGSVSYLSPYISRGVISTKFVLETLLENGFDPFQIEKFIQELAWRDFWQLQWRYKKTIDIDLKNIQPDQRHQSVSHALQSANTGIEAVDNHVKLLKSSGYMHNHMRMYTASIECNIGGAHWLEPAKWMYYYLLDGDWGSNALSWQWVAAANSNKKYFANQENINHFTHSEQKGSFLDCAYEDFNSMQCPDSLLKYSAFNKKTPELIFEPLKLNPEWPSLVYTSYNLDPNWRSEEKANRILFFDKNQLDDYPISQKVVDFILALSKNITDIQFFYGSFEDLVKEKNCKEIIFKEHPFSRNWQGQTDERDWMFDFQKDVSSFFPFWKKCRKQLKTYGKDA